MNHPRIVLLAFGFVVCSLTGFAQQPASGIRVDYFQRVEPSGTQLRLGELTVVQRSASDKPISCFPQSVTGIDYVLLSRVATTPAVTGNASIHGGVFSTKGIPMIGASAYLYPGNIRVPIQEDGTYLLNNLEPGSYSVTIVHPGYHVYMSKVTATTEETKGTVLLMRRIGEVNEMDTIKRELDKVQRICARGFKTKHTTATSAPVTPPQTTTERSGTLVVQTPPVLEQAPTIAEDNHELHAEDLVTEVSVLPNPAQESATINFALANESKVLLEVFSIETGQRVMLLDLGTHKSGESSTRMNISNLSRGTYSVLVRASSCQYALTTFVKE